MCQEFLRIFEYSEELRSYLAGVTDFMKKEFNQYVLSD